MAYTKDNWQDRIGERTDLSTTVVHLTREGNGRSLLNNLLKILKDKKLIGSTTESGFITGKIPCVCFQDAPLQSISQNVWFEQKFREQDPKSKTRYNAVGITFMKNYAYKKGARPVIYEKKSIAKRILPPEEWWRIVNFNLSDDDSIIDWTHEREWRCPIEFKFKLSEVTVLLVNTSMYKRFIKECEKDGRNFHKKIKGIVVMSEVLF